MIRRIILLMVTIVAMTTAEPVHGKEKITWPYICYFPLYICEGNKVSGGYGLDIFNIIASSIPEYEHQLEMLPVKRALEDMRKGANYLYYGLYKTPDREKYLYYSLPCRIALPTMLVIRKSDLDKYDGGKTLSIDNLIRNKTYKLLLFNSISYGPGVDEVIKENEKNPNIYMEYRTDEVDRYALDLLLNNRIDCMLSLNGTQYLAKKMGVADNIHFIRINEQSEFKAGYITAPRNEWGRLMIDKVNNILRKEVPTDQFFNLFAPLVSEDMVPELRLQFNKLIVEPATSQIK